MKKEWFSTMELTGLAGLPSTIQGINQKARREEWKSRKRVGVQGKAVEYHIDSLPDEAKYILSAKEDDAVYVKNEQEPLALWIAVYHQLTPFERERLISHIIRHGVSELLSLLDEKA